MREDRDRDNMRVKIQETLREHYVKCGDMFPAKAPHLDGKYRCCEQVVTIVQGGVMGIVKGLAEVMCICEECKQLYLLLLPKDSIIRRE